MRPVENLAIDGRKAWALFMIGLIIVTCYAEYVNSLAESKAEQARKKAVIREQREQREREKENAKRTEFGNAGDGPTGKPSSREKYARMMRRARFPSGKRDTPTGNPIMKPNADRPQYRREHDVLLSLLNGRTTQSREDSQQNTFTTDTLSHNQQLRKLGLTKDQKGAAAVGLLAASFAGISEIGGAAVFSHEGSCADTWKNSECPRQNAVRLCRWNGERLEQFNAEPATYGCQVPASDCQLYFFRPSMVSFNPATHGIAPTTKILVQHALTDHASGKVMCELLCTKVNGVVKLAMPEPCQSTTVVPSSTIAVDDKGGASGGTTTDQVITNTATFVTQAIETVVQSVVPGIPVAIGTLIGLLMVGTALISFYLCWQRSKARGRKARAQKTDQVEMEDNNKDASQNLLPPQEAAVSGPGGGGG